MIRRVLLALFLAALVGCGGGGEGRNGAGGDARLWVTVDRGSDVVLTATVPAGLTVLQALDREADVETRYGGRFVQSINGIGGDLARQRDWFYFVNGIEPDVGAAEVTLGTGDVAWWDFRSWRGAAEQQPAAVGAFPEPFRHGFAGRRRPVLVRAPAALAAEARALRDLLGPGAGGGAPHRFLLEVRPGAAGAALVASRGGENASPVTFRLSGSLEAVGAAARALALEPEIVRFRYAARFDAHGRVTG